MRATQGEEIVIARAERPVARLVPLVAAPPRHFGVMDLDVPEDFDLPLTAGQLATWEG